MLSSQAVCLALENMNIHPSRRSIFGGVATTGALWFGGGCAANADPMNAFIPIGSGGILQPYAEKVEDWRSPQLITKLGSSRIGSSSLLPIQQPPFASQDIYYPSFLFGSWEVESNLKQKSYPFGKDFVPSKSLLEGSPRNRNEKVGSSTSFQLHYFSMIAEDSKSSNTISNVDLNSGLAQTKIISDRRFNSISTSSAYQQLTPIEEIEWDYRSDPTRLTLRFGAAPVSDDMRPLGQRRGEVYLTARQTELSKDGSIFCAAERSRSITVGPGTVVVADQESITEFQQLDGDTVRAISRIAVYLTPNPNSREGVLWQQVGGKAVAFFDYEWSMKRIKEDVILPDGSATTRACVVSPKSIVQCAL